MKNNKMLPIIIAVLCIILVCIVIFGISIFSKGKTNAQSNNEKNNNSSGSIIPELSLTLNTQEDEQDEVIIQITATTNDEEGIDYIQLPDNSKIYSSNYEYKVDKNGKYQFTVLGKNGEQKSSSINVENIRKISANNPYIPEGFEHIGGEPDSGFIIKDKYGNEYVWVPVPTGMLTRFNMLSTDYKESNSSATALVNSVAKNYGFYIARFEASAYNLNGEKVAASMPEKLPWTGVDFRQAEQLSVEAAEKYGYVDAATGLINSYAWDTVNEWIDKEVPNFSSNTSYGNYSGTVYPTGSTESDMLKSICDIAGNVREWTTEEYAPINNTGKKTTKPKSTNKNEVENSEIIKVIRGGSANLNKIPSSRNGYPENLTDEYWGFRMILYSNI